MSASSEIQSAVVDTDVVSLTFKRDTRASLYRPHLDGRALTFSFMTIAELQRWALDRRWGERQRSALDQYLRQFAVCHSNEDLCRWWASVMAGAKRKGRRIEVADAWIAATALLFGVPLITHNPGDYLGVDELQILTAAAAT